MAFNYSLGAEELNGRGNLYRAIFAEFFGIFILNFFGCAACAQHGDDKVLISLAFGLSVFCSAMVRMKFMACNNDLSDLQKFINHFDLLQ